MMTAQELKDLIDKAVAAYNALPPSQKLRHNYMQRRSFVRGMCPSKRDYGDWCSQVDVTMPHEATLTDAEIGLILSK